MYNLLADAEAMFEYTQTLRRDFHRHPELGLKEVRTSGIVAKELTALGLEVATGIAETGVVGMLDSGRPGPVLLLRFDMDALPITEQTGAEYASQNPGVMHACGHDGHIAIGLTIAHLLKAHRQDLLGKVKLVFQPAEEGEGGAEEMVAEGVLENPRPDMCLALHLWNNEPFGWLSVTDGPVMAAADIFTIRVTGKGGHGALPNLAVDPVVASAHIITALQTVVSRNVSPLDTAVVSVASLQAGDAFNVIPPYVEMSGTIRTFDPAIRQMVEKRCQQIIEQVGAAFSCQVEVEIKSITPAVINDSQLAQDVQQTIRKLLPEGLLVTDFRTMGSEDMAFMMQDIPGCYFFIGSANAEKGLIYGHHHPKFDYDERALSRGAGLMASIVLELMHSAEQ